MEKPLKSHDFKGFFRFFSAFALHPNAVAPCFYPCQLKKSSFRVDFSVMIWEQPATLMSNNAVIEVKEGSGDRIGIS